MKIINWKTRGWERWKTTVLKDGAKFNFFWKKLCLFFSAVMYYICRKCYEEKKWTEMKRKKKNKKTLTGKRNKK